MLPNVIIIDEPELGLHPAAINILAELLKMVSQHCQIIVATQSAAMLDSFEAEDIVVVDRDDKQSTFKRLNESDLSQWLEDYTLGQLWEKNVFGGGPYS